MINEDEFDENCGENINKKINNEFIKKEILEMEIKTN